jgi:hypothetical protein
MNVMAIDQPNSSIKGSTDMRPNEYSERHQPRTDNPIQGRNPHVLPFFIPRFPDLRSDDRAKAKDDAWAAATRFYNAYQETAVRALEQRQKAKGKHRAGQEEDLRVSELRKALQGSRRRATLH